LPNNEFEAKIEHVEVALVDATSPSGRIPCLVRHGGRYVQKKRTGEDSVMLLAPRLTSVAAFTSALATHDISPTSGAATLEAPRTFEFWGRGVCLYFP
jgi:hypothetical protein